MRNINATSFEYNPPAGIEKVEVKYNAGSSLVEIISLYFLKPVSRSALVQKFHLAEQSDAEAVNAEGKLQEVFGGRALVAMTYASAEKGSGVSRIAYLTREVFSKIVPPGVEDAAAYAAWYAVRSNTPEAIGKAEAYLERFPNGQYADYLKKWTASVASTSFNDAATAKNVTEMIRIGKKALAQDPDNLDYLVSLVIQINTNELFARPPSFAHTPEATDFAERAIRLIEAGKTPTPAVQPFNRNLTLAYFHNTLAVVYEHDQNPDGALREFEMAATLDPTNAFYPFHSGRVHQYKYLIAARRYQSLPAGSSEENALYGDLIREADAIIDSWSRVLALTARNDRWVETRDKIEGAVTELRKFRNEVNEYTARGGTASVKKSGKLERLGAFLGEMTRALLQNMKPPDQ